MSEPVLFNRSHSLQTITSARLAGWSRGCRTLDALVSSAPKHANTERPQYHLKPQDSNASNPSLLEHACPRPNDRRLPCGHHATYPKRLAFEVTSKRRKGFPSETRVKRGDRVVHGDKELIEKLGRNDLCPCGSRRLFQKMLPQIRPL